MWAGCVSQNGQRSNLSDPDCECGIKPSSNGKTDYIIGGEEATVSFYKHFHFSCEDWFMGYCHKSLFWNSTIKELKNYVSSMGL